MACLIRAEVALVRCTLLFLYLTACLCQRDCTGVDCPLLDNCIEEALESGACCASCLQKGCTCEGYQYYDCINAGFKNGKVPEGNSYFVDYGSTECSCPAGGGRISCHFISCPDIPPNCIEVSEPADGCMQCERIGCVQDGQKYDAGHSFHIEPCRVCHCPNEGGKLMCYPVPNCDPKKFHNPVLAATKEEDKVHRHDSYPYTFDQQRYADQFPTMHHLSPSENVPLFKPLHMDKDEQEDYDYSPTDFAETYPQSLIFPTQSSSSNKVISLSTGADRSDRISLFDRRNKLELVERYGVHDHAADIKEKTENPLREEQSTVRPHTHKDTSTFPQHSQGLTSVQSVSFGEQSPQMETENPLDAHGILGGVMFLLKQGLGPKEHKNDSHMTLESEVHDSVTKEHHQNTSDSVIPRGWNSQINVSHQVRDAESQTNHQSQSERMNSNGQKELLPTLTLDSEEQVDAKDMENQELEEIVNFQSVTEPEGKNEPYEAETTQQERSDKAPESSDTTSNYEKTTTEPSTSRGSEYYPTPRGHFTTTTTTQLPVQVKLDESEPTLKSGQSLFNFDSEDQDEVEAVKKLEAVTENEEEGKDHHVLVIKPSGAPGVSAEDLLPSCCTAGMNWATEKHHCNHMPLLDNERNSICSVAQKQCCLSSVKESQCELGMAVARRGDTCEVEEKDQCTDDSNQVCCSCCTLGLRVRSEGRSCDAHQYLGYPCGHVFLTCCEEEEGPSQIQLKRQQKPKPTALPKKVSDTKFPKEAFSISATDEAANTVEEQEDVDECQLYAGQLCQHTCINIWGSYLCECHQGYILQQDRHSCVPVSPDEDNRVREDSPAVVPTQTTTTMATTASTTTTNTVPLNPCAGNGPCSQQCIVAVGRALCSCFSGFSLMTDGHTCEDDVLETVLATRALWRKEKATFCTTGNVQTLEPVPSIPGFNRELGPEDGVDSNCPCKYPPYNDDNRCLSVTDVDECVASTHSCLATERCVNTVGSFVCELQVTCPAGYQLRSGICEDIDECALQTHNCRVGLVCENTVGSFLCNLKHKCISGFTEDAHGNCIDINECSSLSEPCISGFNCINTVGSYTCQKKIRKCSHGYHSSPDGAKCVDIDECQMGTHHCAVGQICHNLPGSYRCDCQTGYQYDALRKVCTDVNECWRYPGRLCAQTCENTPGSYHCSCTAGFSLAIDGKNCEDVNECDRNPCGQECANIYGSYQCYCRQGYYLKEDGHTCEDIDECSQSIGNLCSFKCVNVPGSYQCACPPHGYVLSSNGRTCKDIDECTTGTHNCSHGHTCYNLQGSYRCLSFNCPHNYKKVSDTRCERLSCPINSLDCQSSPVRITYYQLSFQTNIIIPAQIFRIGPSPAYSGDHIVVGITKGNEEGYFSTRKLNSFTGAVYLTRHVHEPKDFVIDVEMKLLRQGTFTSFLARIYVFITSSTM